MEKHASWRCLGQRFLQMDACAKEQSLDRGTDHQERPALTVLATVLRPEYRFWMRKNATRCDALRTGLDGDKMLTKKGFWAFRRRL